MSTDTLKTTPSDKSGGRCRHRHSWLLGACWEWCYRCGAIRRLSPVDVNKSVVDTYWQRPVGPTADNPGGLRLKRSGKRSDCMRIKGHKYRAKATVVDGIRFASQKEARRYQELKMLERGSVIRNLRLQPRYALCPLVIEAADVRNLNAGEPTPRRLPVAHYVADFEYEECDHGNGHRGWRLIVEDTKGVKTEAYRLKKRWFEAQYGIEIREV